MYEKRRVVTRIFGSYLTFVMPSYVRSRFLVLHSLNAGVSLLGGPHSGTVIFVWLLLSHIETLTIIHRKTIRLCVCNCLWVTSSAKYSPPAFLNVFFPLQYVHQMPVSVVLYWVMIAQSGASHVLTELCIFPAKLGQWKISDSALSGKKRRRLNRKQGQNHVPWFFVMDASMPCLWW